MKKTGVIILFLMAANTVSLWILSKQDVSLIFIQPFRALGQISGLLASVAICAEFILATRLKVLESLFGGLDKVYQAHAVIGAMAFLLMLNHPLALAVNVLPSVSAATKLFLPSTNIPYTYGILGLYAMVLLLSATLFVRLPYHVWKNTHIFMVVPQIFILLHVFFISSDTSNYLPLKMWILGLGLASLIAYAYKRFFYGRFGNRHFYQVSEVRQFGDIIELTFLSINKRLQFQPGQFVFLSLDDSVIGKEEHPFTIASAPGEAELKLSIKFAGDYTSRLALAKQGTIAKVYGPYGAFGEKSLAKSSDDIWIAGGIGITPFLSLMGYYASIQSKKNIWLFYSGRQEQNTPYLDDIRQLVAVNENIRFFHHLTESAGRLTAGKISKAVGGFDKRKIFMCGPQPMVEGLWEQFIDLGVKPKNIIFEEFNFLA